METGKLKRVDRKQEAEYYRAKDYLSKGLDILRDGLEPFVKGVLTERDGKDWHQQPRIQRMLSISAQEYAETGPPLDVAILLRIIGSEAYWQRTFRVRLPGISLWMIDGLKELRNSTQRRERLAVQRSSAGAANASEHANAAQSSGCQQLDATR
jgi:hypothetical protein